ncbi:MAG: FtsX-like permease family protein [Clostridia bacterium]|nr:FtsX-like permease family protein [Clostridia bacterium]
MFFDILKRDLKRKPLTNIIMLLFVVLSVVFISSSVNNLFALFGSLDRYFEKAGIGDYVVFELYGGNVTVRDVVENVEAVKGIRTEEVILSSYKFDTDQAEVHNEAIISCPSQQAYLVFDSKNEKITSVQDGAVYVRQSALDQSGAKVGDLVTLTVQNIPYTFIVKDTLKDALLGIDRANVKFLISDQDYQTIKNEIEKSGAEQETLSYFHLIDFQTDSSDSVKSLEEALSACKKVHNADSREAVRNYYLADMLVVGILVAASFGLILIAVTVLGFTISSTLNREFRQIGILKAIGISNGKIRLIYLVKYLIIAVVGAIVGLVLSFPFGAMMQKDISKSILIENENAVLIGVLCSVFVTCLILAFSLLCTRKVIRFTPMNAFRSGTTGERYRRKNVIRLGTSRISTAILMAANDILSNKRHTALMAFVFFIGMVLLMVLLNTSSTMNSKHMLTDLDADISFDMTIKERNQNPFKYAVVNGRDEVSKDAASIETMLAEEGWQADCIIEPRLTSSVYAKENPRIILQVLCREGVNGSPDMYSYIEGSAPQSKDEIAISYRVAERLGLKIGDRIIINLADDKDNSNAESERIITAIYQDFLLIQWGSVRLYPDKDYNYESLYDVQPASIVFKDNPGTAEIGQRVKQLREKYTDKYIVRTASEQILAWWGDVLDKTNAVEDMLLLVIALINILIAALMELSFLTKERGEIAMLKAIGFKDGTIILWQVLRIGMVLTIATLLAIALADPFGRLTLGGVFHYCGIAKLVFVPNVLKNYIVYPAVIFATTVFGAFLVALGVRKIHSKEINSVE